MPPAIDLGEALARRLRGETQGEVLFDAASRGRYATDASIYQIMPVGVLVPRSERDVATAIDIARDLKVPVLARGAGTSQCGQTTGAALVVDNSKHLRRVLARAKKMGFDRVFPVTGQTYSRKIDTQVLDALNGLAQSAHKWGTDLRLLAHRQEIDEPFEALGRDLKLPKFLESRRKEIECLLPVLEMAG